MKNPSRLSRASTVILMGLFLTACASTSRQGNWQTIAVQTSPNGATVYYRHRPICRTPCFVPIMRSRKTAISIHDDTGRRELPLQSSYRWGESFFSNLVFFYLAPLGWSIDAITGNAWEVHNPPVVDVTISPPTATASRGKSKSTKKNALPLIAIAPPQAESIRWADDAGEFWQEQLQRRFPNHRILPYRETLPIFARHLYDYDRTLAPDTAKRYDLLADLGAQQIFESKLESRGSVLSLEGQLHDVFTNEVLARDSARVTTTHLLSDEDWPWYQRHRQWIKFVPNTAALELTGRDTAVETNRGQYFARRVKSSGFAHTAAQYVGALGLYNMEPPRTQRSFFWRFRLVPAIQLLFQKVYFPSAPGTESAEFGYMRVAMGYGPEVGWQHGHGYIYFNFIPMIGWHRLKWLNREQEQTHSVGAYSGRAELGYLLFFTNQLSLRLFTSSAQTSPRVWNKAFRQTSNQALDVQDSTDLYVGLSIGYTFQSTPKLRIHTHRPNRPNMQNLR